MLLEEMFTLYPHFSHELVEYLHKVCAGIRFARDRIRSHKTCVQETQLTASAITEWRRVRANLACPFHPRTDNQAMSGCAHGPTSSDSGAIKQHPAQSPSPSFSQVTTQNTTQSQAPSLSLPPVSNSEPTIVASSRPQIRTLSERRERLEKDWPDYLADSISALNLQNLSEVCAMHPLRCLRYIFIHVRVGNRLECFSNCTMVQTQRTETLCSRTW